MAIEPILSVRDTAPLLSRRAVVIGARVTAGIGFAVAFVLQYRAIGFPFDRERVLAWTFAALAITSIGNGWAHLRHAFIDWLPFAVLLVAYDYSRGIADEFGLRVHVNSLVNIERFLFGGVVPTEWLQQRLVPAANDPAAVWELGVSVVYASHFVVPFALAGVLWWRSRARWRSFVDSFLLLSFSAVAIYSVLPTGAPWFAAERGLIEPLSRPVGRGWQVIGLHAAPGLLEKGRAATNPFAAVPSLHAGYSFLVALFIFQMIGRGRSRWLLFLYPFTMGFVIVYGGEHYVIDVFAGWLAAVAALWSAPRARTRLRARLGR